MKVHHIGYFVNDMAQAAEKFGVLGFSPEGGATDDNERGVQIRFFRNGNMRVELISKAREGSMVDDMAAKGASAPYHICYEAEDISAALSELKAQGFFLVRPAAPAPACGGKNVAFLFQKSVGLIEVVEA